MRIFKLIGFLFLANVLLAQNYHFYHYSLRDGVPQSQVTALSLNVQGELLLGTWGGGIASYNGYEFNKTQKNLVNDFVNVIEVYDGITYVGTQYGLTIYNENKSENYTFENGFDAQIVFDILPFKDSIVFATSNGLITKKGDKFKKIAIDLKKNKSIRSICHIGNRIYCAGDYSVFYIENNKCFELKKLSYCTDIQEFGGDVLFATYAQGLWRLNDSTMNKISGSDQWIVYKTTPINQELWFATEKHGILRMASNAEFLNPLDVNNGLPKKAIKSLIQDAVGNVWIGTSGDGLLQLASEKVKFLTRNDGLNGDAVYTIAVDSIGKIYMGAGNGGLDSWHHNKLKHMGYNDGFTDSKCRTLLMTDSLMYLGTEGSGLFVFDGLKFHSLQSKFKKNIGNWIKVLAKLDSGKILVGTAGYGFSIIKGDSIQTFRTQHGLFNNRVSDFLVLTDSTFYVICETGVNYFDGKSLSKINLTTDLKSKQNLLSMLEWKGKLYWASNGGGVVTEKAKKWNTLSKNIYLFKKIDAHTIVVGHEKGIEIHTSSGVEYFSSENGMPSSEICKHAAYYDAINKKLYVGTINGLAIIDLNLKSKKKTIQTVRIETVELFLVPFSKVDKNTELTLDCNQNHLTFRFSAVSLVKNEVLKLRYKLIGNDDLWVESSKDFRAVYSNLQPGQYTFVLQYSYDGKKWYKAQNQVRVNIDRPYYTQWWFILSAALLFCFVLMLFFWMRVRSLKQKTEMHKLHSKLSDLERKALNLQMNPHFLFNSINAIKGLITDNKTKEARHQLTQFAQLMRGILDNSRKELIPLIDEIKTLENYVQLEQSAREIEIDFNLENKEEIDVEEIKIPPLIIQPFIENSIIHGLLHKSGHKEITISIEEHSSYLVCTILDNGLGFKDKIDHKHQSIATKLVEERLALLDKNRRKRYLEKENRISDNQIIGAKVVIYIRIKE